VESNNSAQRDPTSRTRSTTSSSSPKSNSQQSRKYQKHRRARSKVSSAHSGQGKSSKESQLPTTVIDLETASPQLLTRPSSRRIRLSCSVLAEPQTPRKTISLASRRSFRIQKTQHRGLKLNRSKLLQCTQCSSQQ
jgi:hypothetical protein